MFGVESSAGSAIAARVKGPALTRNDPAGAP